jgi:hypothetical protein
MGFKKELKLRRRKGVEIHALCLESVTAATN